MLIIVLENSLITIPQALEMCVKHDISLLNIETNGLGGTYYNHFLTAMENKGVYFKLGRIHNKGNKEMRAIDQRLNVMKFLNFRRLKTHTEMYDKFLLHILSYETGVKEQKDDSIDAISGLAKYIYKRYQYVYGFTVISLRIYR